MTTEYQISRTNDVFVRNDVINLDSQGQAFGFPVAAALWTRDGGDSQEAHLSSLQLVASKAVQDYVLWLLVGHTAWQPDTRISRYRGIWKSLKASGLDIPQGRTTDEKCKEMDGHVRFFSAAHIGVDSLEASVRIIEAEPASQLIAIKSSDEDIVEGLIESGWDYPAFGPPLSVLEKVCEAEGFLMFPIGTFDDRENGCAVFGKVPQIDRLVGS